MRVIQEGTIPFPLHIYKVIDFRLWKGTEESPPHNKKALY
jgi:hypothetical protein